MSFCEMFIISKTRGVISPAQLANCPICLFFSKTMVLYFFSAILPAIYPPMGPPPTIITSYSSIISQTEGMFPKIYNIIADTVAEESTYV